MKNIYLFFVSRISSLIKTTMNYTNIYTYECIFYNVNLTQKKKKRKIGYHYLCKWQFSGVWKIKNIIDTLQYFCGGIIFGYLYQNYQRILNSHL